MTWNKRYASGSSLERTQKELLIDAIDEQLSGSFSDAECREMKNLNLKMLLRLRNEIFKITYRSA